MAVSPIVKKIMQDFDGKLRLVIKDVPTENRKASVDAALAALAAGDQGKYWEMHELLFDRWMQFDRESLDRNARELGLDIERFKQSMNDKKHADTLKRNLNLAEELNVHSTPMFVINGKKYDGELTYREFKKIIEEELRNAKTQY
jgi:protein-disulfide isomerase